MSVLLGIIFIFFSIVASLKIYIKLNRRWNDSYACLVGKTAIVTGANTGIGYVTALDFAMRGARVILACRDKEKAEEARQKIAILTGNPNVVVKLIDLQSLESVRKFAEDINGTEKRIDILVNNGGAMFLGNHRTKDGLQITMQTNHFSPFLLTHLLIDKIKRSAPSRIVNVSSKTAKYYSNLDADDLNKYPEGGESNVEISIYAHSKLCNILFTTELARKLEETGVTTNCLHPGVVLTEIIRSYPTILQLFILFVAGFLFLTTEEGAQTTIFLALSKKVDGVSGELFDNCRQVDLYDTAKDVVLAKKVWKKSEEFVKLREEEMI